MTIDNTPKPGDFLFVYGSLRSGFSASLASNIGASKICDDASIDGTLYDLGWYPGVKVGGTGTVVGEVYEILNEGTWDRLDSYEGYPSLFNRVRVNTDRGIDVWVYTYEHEVPDEYIVKSGDWAVVKGDLTHA